MNSNLLYIINQIVSFSVHADQTACFLILSSPAHNKFLCRACSSHLLPLISPLSPFDAESSFFGIPGPALSPIQLRSVTLLPLTAAGGWLRLIFLGSDGVVKREFIRRLYFQSSWDRVTDWVRVHGEGSDTSECSGVWVWGCYTDAVLIGVSFFISLKLFLFGDWPDMPDETFPKISKLISHIHWGKRAWRTLRKGGALWLVEASVHHVQSRPTRLFYRQLSQISTP